MFNYIFVFNRFLKLCQDTQLCLGLFCCSNIFHCFHFLKFFLLLFIFHHWNFPQNHWNFPQMPSTENYIQVHNSVVCLEGTLLCPAASWGHDFLIFSIISFTFSFAKVFSFNYLIPFLVSFIWNSQKCPVSQNIWCLIKTQLKHITQTIFQGGSPWATLVHNSVVCLRVHYCVLLLPEVMIFWFFQSFPLPFPLLKFFLLIT